MLRTCRPGRKASDYIEKVNFGLDPRNGLTRLDVAKEPFLFSSTDTSQSIVPITIHWCSWLGIADTELVHYLRLEEAGSAKQGYVWIKRDLLKSGPRTLNLNNLRQHIGVKEMKVLHDRLTHEFGRHSRKK